MESEKSWEISLLSVFLCFTWFSFVFLDGVSNLIVNLLILNRYEKGNMEIHSADAGINSDGDSNNARGDVMYMTPSRPGTYSKILNLRLPRGEEGKDTLF